MVRSDVIFRTHLFQIVRFWLETPWISNDSKQRRSNITDRANTKGHCKADVFVKERSQTDDIGLIWRLRERDDIRAVKLLRILCVSKKVWKQDQDVIFALTFGMQLYFSETIAYWAAGFLATKPNMHTEATVWKCMKQVTETWRGIKRQADGGYANTGMCMTMNPSERQDGSVRYKVLSSDLAGVRMMARQMASISHPVQVREALSCLVDNVAYDNQVSYKNMRLIRSIAASMGWVWADTEQCWHSWRSMSKSVSEKCKGLYIWDYEEALIIRDVLRQFSSDYCFADLVCYVCLMK
jgi:hypothetical protein